MWIERHILPNWNGPVPWHGLPVSTTMGRVGRVKITLDIHDALLARSKRHAQKTGLPLRAVVEEDLQNVLSPGASRPRYQLPDWSHGDASRRNPLQALSWQELCEMAYGGPQTRCLPSPLEDNLQAELQIPGSASTADLTEGRVAELGVWSCEGRSVRCIEGFRTELHGKVLRD